MTLVIDGKQISATIKDELKEKVAKLKEQDRNVTLAVVQVGDDKASSVYVENKKKACEYIGIASLSFNEDKVIQAIEPKKDVDGFHPANVGRLSIGIKGFVSCTPQGVIELLKRSNISIEGKECVVLGRSNIVGKPMAMLLLRENGTVTICHSKTKDLKEVTKRADILIVAIGKPKYITSEYVKEGAVVIDVGIHRGADNKLCGDVDYMDVFDKVSAITPVPGGVGPMTIAMLMNNCVESVSLS